MRTISPKECEPGMVTAEQVLTPIGQVLAPAGTELTRQLINRMKLYRVETVLILDDGSVPAATPVAPPPTETKPVAPAQPVAPKPVAPAQSVVSAQPVAPKPAAPAQSVVSAQPAAPKPAAPAQPTAPKPVAPVQKAEPKTLAESMITHTQKVAASDEFQDFRNQYFASIEKLKAVFDAACTRGQNIDTNDLLYSVSDLFKSRNTIIELFDMLYNMRIVKDAIYAHCLNVGLISRMFGRWLKMEAHDLNALTMAGLLHDIGKVKIPSEILDKPGKLTDEEFALIRQHPKLGYDILKNQPIDPRIKKAALMHHERCDGSGYPSGLEEDLIEEFAMIVGIADVYDAMTAARAYRAPLCPFQVISNFEDEGFQKYHTKYILTLLKQIAATYQSNRVMLNDGRSCNIVMLNPNSLSRPMVQLDDGSIIDLNTKRDLFIKAVM